MLNIKDYQHLYEEEKGWTAAFEEAVQDLMKLGGGMLYVPAGVYETCSIQLFSNIQLFLESGAELRYLMNCDLYRTVEVGYEGKVASMYMPLIYAKDAENVILSGHGTLNGQGAYWWERIKSLECGRPYLIHFECCTNVKVLDVQLINSPAWTIHPHFCYNVEISGVSIKNPKDSPNTDGINPESCKNVKISNCNIDVGDDCITLKAGTEESPRLAPCENIVITNCNMVHGHGGVVIGSEMSGTVKNVTISNCVFQDTDRGIRVKTRRGRGGSMERIVVSNIIMENVLCPFVFNMFYQCGMNTTQYKEKVPHPVTEKTPVIKDIQIQNVIATNVISSAAFFYGLPEMPIENISLSDCRISMTDQRGDGYPAMMEDIPKMQAEGIYLRFAKDVTLRNFKVLNVKQEEVNVDDTVERFRCI